MALITTRILYALLIYSYFLLSPVEYKFPVSFFRPKNTVRTNVGFCEHLFECPDISAYGVHSLGQEKGVHKLKVIHFRKTINKILWELKLGEIKFM